MNEAAVLNKGVLLEKRICLKRWMNELQFTSFLTVFQSHQDDGRMIMKRCMQWNPVTVEKISVRAGLKSGTARSQTNA